MWRAAARKTRSRSLVRDEILPAPFSPGASRGRRAGDEGAALSKTRSRALGVCARGSARRFRPNRQRDADCPSPPVPSPAEAVGEGRKNGSEMNVFQLHS
jgi:hypothetical protein